MPAISMPVNLFDGLEFGASCKRKQLDLDAITRNSKLRSFKLISFYKIHSLSRRVIVDPPC